MRLWGNWGPWISRAPIVLGELRFREYLWRKGRLGVILRWRKRAFSGRGWGAGVCCSCPGVLTPWKVRSDMI